MLGGEVVVVNDCIPEGPSDTCVLSAKQDGGSGDDPSVLG